LIDESSTWLFTSRFSLFSRTLFFILVAVTLICMDGRLDLLNQIRYIAEKAFAPMAHFVAKSAQQAESISGFFVDTYTLQKHLRALEQEAVRMRVDQSRLQALESENQKLRGLLASAPSDGFSPLLAAPLKLGRNPLLATALIDRGKDHVLPAGAVVIAKELLIGQVARTSAQSSEVMLVTDPRILVPVEVNGTLGVASGDGEGSLQIVYQPTTTAIEKGNPVLTSAIGKIYPPHLAVGTVISVDRNPNAPYARILVSPAATINTAPLLAVLRPQ
jgi:rod shape-determining protein MreC